MLIHMGRYEGDEEQSNISLWHRWDETRVGKSRNIWLGRGKK